MNGAATYENALEQAFRQFERAASSLERRQSTLQAEVDRLERKLDDKSRELEAVLDALDEGVAVIAGDGSLRRTNRAFDRMELARPDGRLCHPSLVELVAADRPGGVTRVRDNAGGATRDLLGTLTPVGDTVGTRVLAVRDVTEIRREEEEGGRRHRLEALGRMAAELAHEVRNPLGSIRLFAGMLREDLADRAEERSMVEQILSATAGLEGTVTNLLAFAAPARGRRCAVDLAAIAAEVCRLLIPSCSLRGVSLTGPADADSCPLEGEPEGLRQVLLNLLGNALEATAQGGTIRVGVARVAGDGNDTVRLEIEDDGRGIGAADLPRVFDPFFTRTAGGTGLGLSIVQRTVERHGGRIALDSQPGRGTRVRVELPVALAAPVEESHG